MTAFSVPSPLSLLFPLHFAASATLHGVGGLGHYIFTHATFVCFVVIAFALCSLHCHTLYEAGVVGMLCLVVSLCFPYRVSVRRIRCRLALLLVFNIAAYCPQLQCNGDFVSLPLSFSLPSLSLLFSLCLALLS